MIVEGRGEVVPKPKSIFLDSHELSLLKQEAERRASFRQYKSQPTKWENGLKPKVLIPRLGEISREVRPILVGLVGEYAVCRFIGDTTLLDTLLRDSGDGGVDVNAFGITIQVKTKQRLDGDNLVRVKSSSGIEMPVHCNLTVFCCWELDSEVKLLGWVWKREVESCSRRTESHGHENIVVPPEKLSPMTGLLDVIAAKKGLNSC